MATVRLTRYECEHNLLPRVCARCGCAPSTSVRFALFTPFWNVALATLLVLCPPVFVIAAHFVSKRHRYQVPMCGRDHADWRWRDQITTWTYLLFVFGAYCAAVVLIVFVFRDSFPVWAGLGYMAAIYSWLPFAALTFIRTVRATKVMKRGIRLSGVHPDFVRAVMADRVAARETDPERVAWYGDLRDDFEEDWNEFGAFRPDASPEPARPAEPEARARAD